MQVQTGRQLNNINSQSSVISGNLLYEQGFHIARTGGTSRLLDSLNLIGRTEELFTAVLTAHERQLSDLVRVSAFLVIGAAGTIGQAVTKEIFARQPRTLHAVDISENNLVELVRDIRSSLGYIKGDFRTFALDAGSPLFEAMVEAEGPYDYILNLSALKHVRSEQDPYTLMRMIEVNILNTEESLKKAIASSAQKYFCVSTDKAANPVNMMGASKKIMELFLMRRSLEIPVSMARFANVVFSDGSLLHGFNQRLLKNQPLSAPCDVKRYFITPQESGELCLLSAMLGENRDIFFPKLSDKLQLISFDRIAEKYLAQRGFEAVACETEEEARRRVEELKNKKKWPCYFFDSDTTGEKDFEEFYTDRERLDLERFNSIGVIKNEPIFDTARLDYFLAQIALLKENGCWTRQELISLFHELLPGFAYKETGKFLNERM
jgi:UDP-N-acetylglucosamine 4,6-dehydratase